MSILDEKPLAQKPAELSDLTMSNRTEHAMLYLIQRIPGSYVLAAFMLVLWGIVGVQGHTPSVFWIERHIGATAIGYWHVSLMICAWLIARHDQSEWRAVLFSFPILLYFAALLSYAIAVPSAGATAGAVLLAWAYVSTIMGMYLRKVALKALLVKSYEVNANAIPADA